MEISRTSLGGFYSRKDPRERKLKPTKPQWGLKIIKSWRLHFSKQKISTIGQAIWTLFSYYLFRKNIFFDEPQKYLEKSCLESFIQSEPNDCFVAEAYMNAINFFFFYVEVSLKYYSSPLNMQNKTSSRTTLLQSFFI